MYMVLDICCETEEYNLSLLLVKSKRSSQLLLEIYHCSNQKIIVSQSIRSAFYLVDTAHRFRSLSLFCFSIFFLSYEVTEATLPKGQHPLPAT